MVRRLRAWAEDRFGLTPINKAVLKRRVVKTPWYYGDGAALALLFAVLVATGVTMTITYSPSPESAYDSVIYITEHQPLGWLTRALHYWAAGMMVVVLFLHMFRQILLGGYKFPREGTWLVGVLLFYAVLMMSFTGYVLRWDARALYALRVVLHMLYNVPVLGESLVLLVQGGAEVGTRTISRFYALHVIILPLLIIALVGWHIYLVMLHGVTSPGERRRSIRSVKQQRDLYREHAESDEHGETFHPHTTMKSGLVAVLAFLVVVVLALTIGPATLETPANLVDRVFPVEEWWFWWYSALIALLPPAIAPTFVVVFPILLFVLLIALPFLDRGPSRGLRRRPIAVIAVLLAATSLFVLSDVRRRSPWTAWPGGEPPPVPENVELPPEAELGRQLFARYGCNTCHAVAGHGWTFGPDFARLDEPRSREKMREYILQPPEGIAMPAYRGRINDEQLERLLDYVQAAQTFPRE